MLYDRWRQVAAARRNELALVDGPRSWTFRQLSEAAEALSAPQVSIVVAEGKGAEFILQTVQCWKHGVALCPIEPGQNLPLPSASLPPGCIHLKTTSGSTGSPRFVALTEEQLGADAENIVATMKLGAPNLAAISLAHSYGFSNLITPLLLHGVPLALCESPLPENLLRTAARFERVTIPSVPALWQVWADAGAIPQNIDAAISAGAPLPLPLERRVWEEFGVKLRTFYGASECGGIAYDTGPQPRQNAAFIGQPLRNVMVERDASGRLTIQSAAVAQTYWPTPDPELQAGRFITSDIGEITAEGICLTGRLSDQINVAGRKVSPEAVEQAILASGMVRQCVVFGADHPIEGQQIVAAIPQGQEVNIPRLRRTLSESIPNWQIPHVFWRVTEITANARGKISRAEWSRKYSAER